MTNIWISKTDFLRGGMQPKLRCVFCVFFLSVKNMFIIKIWITPKSKEEAKSYMLPQLPIWVLGSFTQIFKCICVFLSLGALKSRNKG